LYNLDTEEKLQEIVEELRDRFGNPPEEVEFLYEVVRIKLIAEKIGFRRVRISEHALEAEFPPESDTQYYESEDFQHLMTTLSRGSGTKGGLRQEGTTLSFYAAIATSVEPTTLLSESLQILTKLLHSRDSLRVSVTAEK